MAAQIPESDQIKQFKEFLGTYNKLTETCFLDCVKDFTTREVKPEEVRKVLLTEILQACHKHYHLFRTLPTEIFKNDTKNIHEISGISYSAE
nr:mitochondrial import inner membrane translocase subunit Tim9 isoform X1 [Chlorocebus sabaeus]